MDYEVFYFLPQKQTVNASNAAEAEEQVRSKFTGKIVVKKVVPISSDPAVDELKKIFGIFD